MKPTTGDWKRWVLIDTYSSIVVPVILDRLPEAVRLIVTRGKDFHKWMLEDLLLPLKRVNSAEKRKELLKKYSHCFNCLKKGHLAHNCTVKVKCNACSRDHHTALRDRSKVHEDKPKEPEVDGEVGKVGKVGNCTLVVSPKNSIVKLGCRVAL